MVLTNDEVIAKKINSAVFPGIQGGPLMHVIAGQGRGVRRGAEAFVQGLRASRSSTTPARWPTLPSGGLDIVSGGTDTHLMLVDLRPKGVTGRDAE
jgi:glycine hydroxymethyltransferase